MVWVAAAAAVIQLGVGMQQSAQAARESLRQSRAQQAANNEALRLDIRGRARQDIKITAGQRLALGAGNVAGGGTTAANARDANDQKVLDQEQSFRQIDTSLQDERTKNPLADMANSYYEAVYGKPLTQFNKEYNRVYKGAEKEVGRLNDRVKGEWKRFKKRFHF